MYSKMEFYESNLVITLCLQLIVTYTHFDEKFIFIEGEKIQRLSPKAILNKTKETFE